MASIETRSKKTIALSAIIRLCSDLERRQESDVLKALRDYIAATDEAEREVERELSEVGALIGAASTAQECQVLMSQALSFVRTGKKAVRAAPKPLRAFALVGGRR